MCVFSLFQRTSPGFRHQGAQLLLSFSRAGARPSDLHAAAKRGDLRQLQQRLAEGVGVAVFAASPSPVQSDRQFEKSCDEKI